MLPELYIPLSRKSAELYYSKKDEKYPIRGGYRTHPLEAGKAMDARPNLVYPIPAPDGTEIMPKRQWLWGRERTFEALKNNELEITKGKDGWVVSSKQYLREEDGSIRPAKMLSIIDDVYTQHGTNEMIKIFGNAKIFPYPKPSEFVKQLVSVISENKNEIFLDFFSGSAATAHAVMQLNAEDGGNRRFTMVQLPEVCAPDSEAAKAGYSTICEIGKERIRRAGKKIAEEVEESNRQLKLDEEPKKVPDIGFRVLKIDSSNFQDVSAEPGAYVQETLAGLADNVKPGRTADDLLFQVLPAFQIPLSARIEKLDMQGVAVFSVDEGRLVACFDKDVPLEVITAMAQLEPDYAVMRDASFAGDEAVSNFGELFKTYSPATITKVV